MQDTDYKPSPDQQRALQEVYCRLVAAGRWPTFAEADRALDKQGVDLQDAAHGLPQHLSNLGSLRLMGRDEVILQPEALRYCRPDSIDDMDLILRIVWHAIERDQSYDPGPGDPDEPKVTSEELSQALGFPESRLLRLYPLLRSDYWAGGGGVTSDGHFDFLVTRQIRTFRGVQTYADYLSVREQIRGSQPFTGVAFPNLNSLIETLNQRTGLHPVADQGADTGPPPSTSEPQPISAPTKLDATHDEYRYDVALSFAGEDREYVDQVAQSLTRAAVPGFYDKYEEAILWGKDLVAHLDDIYRKQSRFVVPFISRHYAAKAWPRHEIRSALARAIQEKGEFILPARFDDTDVPGLQPTIAYVDCHAKTPDQLAAFIIEKISALVPTGSSAALASATQPSTSIPSGEAPQATPETTIREQPEPYLTARIVQADGQRPTSVLIRNLGEGPALDSVYIVSAADALGLAAWYMTPPIELDAHESQEFALNVPHGIEQASFTASDDATATPAGQRQRRFFEVFVRAFDNDPRSTQHDLSSPTLLGLQPPSAALFESADGDASNADGRQEAALLYKCRNQHVHRALPHLHSEPELMPFHDRSQPWVEWYRAVALPGRRPPAGTTSPKPNARFVRAELL